MIWAAGGAWQGRPIWTLPGMEGCWSVLTILLADIGAGDIRTYLAWFIIVQTQSTATQDEARLQSDRGTGMKLHQHTHTHTHTRTHTQAHTHWPTQGTFVG